jgi:hypothetical protein
MFVAMMAITPPMPFLTLAAIVGRFDWLIHWLTAGQAKTFTR